MAPNLRMNLIKSYSEISEGMFVISNLSRCSWGMFWTPNFFASPSAHFRVSLAGEPGRKKLSFRASIATSASVREEKITKAAPLCVPLRSLMTVASMMTPKFWKKALVSSSTQTLGICPTKILTGRDLNEYKQSLIINILFVNKLLKLDHQFLQIFILKMELILSLVLLEILGLDFGKFLLFNVVLLGPQGVHGLVLNEVVFEKIGIVWLKGGLLNFWQLDVLLD